MSNDFYNVTGNPINRSFGYSALMRTEFANIAAGFDKLPSVAASAYKLIMVNSASNGLTTFMSPYGGGANINNTAFGTTALVSNVGGVANTAYGAYALGENVSGSSNTAIGATALFNVLGSGNTGVGNNVMSSCTSDNNTAVGNGCLNSLLTGTKNTAIGAGLTGNIITTGSNNTFIGNGADANALAATNRTALGYQAVATADNQVMLGNTSVTEVKSSGKFTSGVGTGSGTATLIGVVSVNTTAVGNVGAGTDDLMTYTLPANSQSANGKGVRVTAWGSTAAVAGAKTIGAVIGSTVIAAHDVSAGAVIVKWHLVVEILRTGANAQICTASFVYNQTGFGGAARTESVTSAEVDTAAIILKVTGNSANAANNDIVQTGMLVEFIN